VSHSLSGAGKVATYNDGDVEEEALVVLIRTQTTRTAILAGPQGRPLF
jgi:hypothetical protein